jgi:hypothetical protein
MKRQTIWRVVLALLSLALIVWLLWFFGNSDPFGHCIHRRKNYQPYQVLHKESLFFIKIGVRLNLNAACAVHVTNMYQGAVTALAGVVVAVFTGTLWWVTWGMVRLAKEQRTDTLRAVTASEAAAIAAQAAADATRKSVDLIPTFERAYISIQPTKRIDTPLLEFDLSFSNFGKTPGILKEIHICLTVDNLPDVPDYANGISAIANTVIAPDGKPHIGAWGIGAPAVIFFIYGYFKYADIFRQTHTTWFAISPNMMILFENSIAASVIGGEAYNHYD